MELEAENWYLDSTSHDFDDKEIFIKKYYFFLSKKISAKTSQLVFSEKIQNGKLSLKSQYKNLNSKKVLTEIRDIQWYLLPT